ncbi:MAG: hypothetical protein JWQ11_611, partial [Rhizobacter sp.]|nr:hypothetical protein [Rhizobacter sp.]
VNCNRWHAMTAKSHLPIADQTPHETGLAQAQEPKYTVVNGRLVNRASGHAIPDDEPVFILRASDVFAEEAIRRYRIAMQDAGSMSTAHLDAVEARERDFNRYLAEHPDRMKVPDTAAVTTPVPSTQPRIDAAVEPGSGDITVVMAELEAAIQCAHHKPGEWRSAATQMGGIACASSIESFLRHEHEEVWASFSYKRDSWLAVAAVNALPLLLKAIRDGATAPGPILSEVPAPSATGPATVIDAWRVVFQAIEHVQDASSKIYRTPEHARTAALAGSSPTVTPVRLLDVGDTLYLLAQEAPIRFEEPPIGIDRAVLARPISEYRPEHGIVAWWSPPFTSVPFIGTAADNEWPDMFDHWTPLPKAIRVAAA